jgi:2-oxoisovalerate dehydrogenase E1 component
MSETLSSPSISFEELRNQVINDYTTACESREASLLGRKEVLTGKAKFGIFGDGKEIAQIAMARAFREGDFRSGYYRDQTFMFAAGMATIGQFFAQLYAIPDVEEDPFSGGRQMNAHFATRSLDDRGEWRALKDMKNSASDTSPTASQMARAVGLALASKKYRAVDALKDTPFSNEGNEVVFATIGDASTSEGIFWESVNAAGVMKIPLAFFVWDDGYGISVPRKYQTTKDNISEVLSGFQLDEDGNGVRIYEVKAWDYPALVQTFEEGIAFCRENHIPVFFHVKEVTQPQGHSTSGSHERYKSKERLEWEAEYDGLKKMREWMLENNLAGEDELDKIEADARTTVKEIQKGEWNKHLLSIKSDIDVVNSLLDALAAVSAQAEGVTALKQSLSSAMDPIRRDVMRTAKRALYITAGEDSEQRKALQQWVDEYSSVNHERYNSHLHSASGKAVGNIPVVPAEYSDNSPMKNGFEILNQCFEENFNHFPELFAFGEDLGKIGDVNQGFAGLQEKFGEDRIFDTGIREATIVGQGIGMAMRGLRPIAEIQYLDYLIYGLQPLTDDLATLQYRTKGGQKAPAIIRTRGHRLEGIWHTGSHMGMVLSTCRGIHFCVPRNMVQAAGMYNMLLRSDEPAIVVECLNGYRLKEKMPDNLAEFTVPLGIPETLRYGDDITVVSYGSTLRIVEEVCDDLEKLGMSIELIDVQTLLPFDIYGVIGQSVRKTNRVIFIDEDVPGGATAFMLDQVFKDKELFQYLDALPQTLSAQPNRAAYASDGDYFCKPNAEDIYEAIYGMMNEVDPDSYPDL